MGRGRGMIISLACLLPLYYSFFSSLMLEILDSCIANSRHMNLCEILHVPLCDIQPSLNRPHLLLFDILQNQVALYILLDHC